MKKPSFIQQIIIYITYLAELLPLILCLIFLNKINTREIKVFFYYTAAFAFFLLLSIFFGLYLKDSYDRLIVNRIFLVVEFAFLSLFYYYTIVNTYKKPVFVTAFILFLCYSVYDFIISKKGDFSFIPLVVECLFFLFVIIYSFYEKLKHNLSSSIYLLPVFWISVGFLIYFSGNFFLFLYSKSMFKDPNFKTLYTLIYGVVTIIKDFFICTAVVINANKINNPASDSIDIDLGTFNPRTFN